MIKNRPDYSLLLKYRREYVRYGVEALDIYYGKTLFNEDVVVLPIDDTSRSILSQRFGIESYVAYASTPGLLETRRKLLKKHNLHEYELVFLILIEVANWAENKYAYSYLTHPALTSLLPTKPRPTEYTNPPSYEEELSVYKAIKKQLEDFHKLLDLIKQEAVHHDWYKSYLEFEEPSYFLRDVTFSYKKRGIDAKARDLNLVFSSNGTSVNFIFLLLVDYLEMLDKNKQTLNDRLLLEQYVTPPQPSLTNNHYLFHYRFIEYLYSLPQFNHIKKPEKSASVELRRIYVELMYAANYGENYLAYDSTPVISIKNWYKKGKEQYKDLTGTI